MGELFDKAIDLILNESVGATIYAFERLPKDYKKCLVHFAKRNVELFDEDPALVLSYLKYDLEDVQDEIKNVIGDDFKKLSIDCSDIHVKQEEEFPSLSVGGRFHSQKKRLEIFPLASLMGAGSVFTEPLVEFNPNIDTKLLQEKILSCRADFIATLAVENLIHELSHLAFPCVTEQKVVDYFVEKDIKKVMREKNISRLEAKSFIEISTFSIRCRRSVCVCCPNRAKGDCSSLS